MEIDNKAKKDKECKDFFYCYSERLENFLYLFGKMYVSRGTNFKTNTNYYVYKRDEELGFLLEQWGVIKERIELPFRKD